MKASLIFAAVALALGAGLPAAAAPSAALLSAVHNPARTPAFVARDTARHPAEELTFFGLRQTANVVEIWPGGGYWTEILAPYLHAHGTYTVALPQDSKEDTVAKFKAKFAARPEFDKIHYATLDKGDYDIAPAGTADFVLTFRNVHNWMYHGYAQEAFNGFFKALKPGGILGVEEHRGLNSVPQDPKAADGYVRQDFTIAMAKKAGFELVGSSELDANPKDTKIWPKGVWTLPPVYQLGAVDHAKYEAIGEADNFILKFRKPK